MDRENRYLSTAQVAETLGLSVTTVKRWVDDGILPAHKTVGGHRKVLTADVLRLVRECDLPQADVTKLFPRPRAAAPGDLGETRRQLVAALKAADHTVVKALVHGAYHTGHPAEVLADRVIGPALDEVGAEWEAGRLSVMQEHRASQAVLATLYEMSGSLRGAAERGGPVAVGGAPAGDPTLVPTLLAKVVLRDAGWEAINLGPDTPADAFTAAIEELRPRLVWVCVTHLPDADAFLRTYHQVYQEAQRRGAAVAVGGRALTKELRERMPYTTFGDGMCHLAAFARTLYQRPGVPKKGRPPRGESRRRPQEGR